MFDGLKTIVRRTERAHIEEVTMNLAGIHGVNWLDQVCEKLNCNLFVSLAMLLVLGMSNASGRCNPVDEFATHATFIFKGTVQNQNVATMPEVPVTESTAVVRVDEVIRASKTLQDFAGKDIAVELSGQQSAPGSMRHGVRGRRSFRQGPAGDSKGNAAVAACQNALDRSRTLAPTPAADEPENRLGPAGAGSGGKTWQPPTTEIPLLDPVCWVDPSGG
jgi:hypothetical protein